MLNKNEYRPSHVRLRPSIAGLKLIREGEQLTR